MNVQVFALIDRVSHLVIPLLRRQVLYSMILFIVIFAITRVLKKRSPYWQLGLWTMLLLRLLLPPDLSFSFSGRSLLKQYFPVDEAYETISGYVVRTFSDIGGRRHDVLLSSDETEARSLRTLDRSITSHARFHAWEMALFPLWFSGIIVCFVLYVKRLARYHLLVKHALPVQHVDLNAMVSECCSRFGVIRPVRLVSSDQYLSPFTIGVVRPIIYLPKSLVKSKDLALLQAIIAHEIVHIKRYDTVWIALQNLIQIFYFFHPLVWYANSQINISRECICDREVLSTCRISITTYGQSLLTVLKLHLVGVEGTRLLASFSSHHKKLLERLQHLKGGHPLRKYHIMLVYVSLAIFGALFLPMARGVTQKSVKKANGTQIQGQIFCTDFFTPFDEPKRHHYQTLQKRIVHPYGEYKSVLGKRFRNAGVDLQGKFGEQVYPIGKGKVIDVYQSFPDSVIIIRHFIPNSGFFYSLYVYLQDIQVKEGEWVTEDTPLARLLSQEEFKRSGLPLHYLHLEIRKNMADKGTASRTSTTMAKLDKYCQDPLEFYQHYLEQ